MDNLVRKIELPLAKRADTQKSCYALCYGKKAESDRRVKVLSI